MCVWRKNIFLEHIGWVVIVLAVLAGPLDLLLLDHRMSHYLVSYICRASARLPASLSTVPHFPSSLDVIRNRKAQTALIHWSAIIELHPQNRTWPHFGVQSLSQSKAFPPSLSPRCSDIENEHDVTPHIKVSASDHLWHFLALCSGTRISALA